MHLTILRSGVRAPSGVLALGVTMLVAACGGEATASPGATAAPEGDTSTSTLASVEEAGVLRVGVRQDLPPYGSEDSDGNLVGFEPDIARCIADKLGVELELVAVTSTTRIPQLTQGRVDMVIAAMAHYRERDRTVDFSIPYLPLDLVVMVPADSGITTLADLEGRRVGTNQGAGTLEALPERVPGVDMQAFENIQDAYLALEQGAVDAISTGLLQLALLRAQSGQPEDYVFLEEPAAPRAVTAVGVRQNDSAWRDTVNFTLQDCYLDGTWDEIFNRWLGPDTDYALTREDLRWEMDVWSES